MILTKVQNEVDEMTKSFEFFYTFVIWMFQLEECVFFLPSSVAAPVLATRVSTLALSAPSALLLPHLVALSFLSLDFFGLSCCKFV